MSFLRFNRFDLSDAPPSDADRGFLRGPKRRQIDPLGQGLGGKLRRLFAGSDHFDLYVANY